MATLASHHERGLAGEGGEQNLTGNALGEVSRQSRLARVGVAEKTEDRRCVLPFLARRFEPGGDGLEGRVLVGGELRHERARQRRSK